MTVLDLQSLELSDDSLHEERNSSHLSILICF